MELVYKFKKGAKIHIKEKNKGSFTKWCGGNVTNECIQRGKNSSNPKIRKKATFAANARHWKHKDGGILKGQGGLKTLIQINENQQRNSPFTYTLIQRLFVPKTEDTHETELFPGKEVVVRGTDRSKQERPYFVSSLTKLLQPSEAMYPLEVLAKPLTYIPGFNYVAPALSVGNYAAALTQGSLNPYKGAEIRANDERLMGAWLPLDFAGPVMLGKGILATGKFAIESAARAGNNTARAYLISKEINLAIKNKPNISNRTISVRRSNNEITGQPDLIYTLYNEFGEPIGLTNVGGAVFGSGNKTHRMVDGVMSMRNAHKVSEDTYNAAVQDIIDNGGKGLESGWSLMMPLKTLAVTSKFPHTVIGLEFGNPVRLLTGTSKRPIPQKVLGNHYLELKPSFEIKYNEATGNFEQIPISNSEPYVSTSLKFFERKPARISEAERAGVPKGERNNINNSGNLEKTVDNIILENRHWLPKETGRFAQKHSSIGSSYRKTFERLWGKENTDRLTDDLLGKLILIRNHLIDTNIPLKGDFVYVVDGQAKAYRNGLEIGYLSNSYINNGKALHPEMVKKQGTNNAGVSELLYNGTILAENRPIISGSRLLMPEVTTHIWSKYPTRKLISTEGVHAWPLRTAQERGIKLNYEKNWHTLPEYSKVHQLALDENVRTNLVGLPIYELSEPSYLPMVKNARIFDISLLRNGYINMDFTPGFAYKQGGKMKKFQLGGFVNPAMAAIPYMNPNSMTTIPYTNPNSMGGSIVQGYFNNLLNLDLILQMQQQKKLAELEEKKLKMQQQNLMFNKVLDIGSNLLTNYLNNKLNLTMSNLNLAIS